MWETGDAQRRKFNAALEMIAEGTNHPEADRVVHVSRAPGENAARYDDHQQKTRKDNQPLSRTAGSIRHSSIVTETASACTKGKTVQAQAGRRQETRSRSDDAQPATWELLSNASYFGGKSSGWTDFAAEADAATLNAASSVRVTGGKQISVLQA
jgi:sugar lactone lactonase YvrE